MIQQRKYIGIIVSLMSCVSIDMCRAAEANRAEARPEITLLLSEGKRNHALLCRVTVWNSTVEMLRCPRKATSISIADVKSVADRKRGEEVASRVFMYTHNKAEILLLPGEGYIKEYELEVQLLPGRYELSVDMGLDLETFGSARMRFDLDEKGKLRVHEVRK